MTLQSSGAISLNQIHIEAGGSSGTACSLNDSDIRGLIGKGSGSSMSFSEWYGASSFTIETQLVITPASSGIKYATPSFSTYSAGIVAGTLGSFSDNRIELDQNQYCYFHKVEGSFFMSGSSTFDFNASTSSNGGGMSRTDYLTGHYWRTGNIGHSSNPSNTLLGASTAYNATNFGFQFIGQRYSISNGIGYPLGDAAGITRTIQVY